MGLGLAQSGECLFDCFDPVIDIGPVSRYFACDERLLGPLREIYGDEAHLLKDKLIFKRPSAQGYGLHQDYIAWPSFPESFITAIVAIDPTDARAFSATDTDGEGLATRRNVLIEDGVLQMFVHNAYTARWAGTASTGNAVRGGFKSTPGVGCRALSLAGLFGDDGEI